MGGAFVLRCRASCLDREMESLGKMCFIFSGLSLGA